jgi:fused signal recognition particle receptor
MGWFDKVKQAFKSGLKRTSTALRTDIRDLFKSQGRLFDAAFLDELKVILIKTDMGVVAADDIIDDLKAKYRARVVEMDGILAIVRAKLESLMAQDKAVAEQPIRFAASGPTVIMVVGVNGSGKTTSIAKLAHLMRQQGKRVVLGAGDTFRAAAVEQLTIWAKRLGVQIITAPPKTHPATVAYQAVEAAIGSGAEVCIVDTAGRLQTQRDLMDELTKIHKVLGKLIPDAPHETLLVLDATTGQPGISQARGFSEAAKCTGIVLAKLDGTAKGGVVVPIRQQLNLPVKYIGVGEGLEDLEVFDAKAFTEALFEEVKA